MQKKWVRGALFASAAAVMATALHLGATPWRISMSLYRRLEKNTQITECRWVALVEELLLAEIP